jgi:hypothetical protein
MKFCTFSRAGTTRVATVMDDAVVDLSLAAPELPRDLVALLAAGKQTLARAKTAAENARDHLAFGHGVYRCAGGHLAQLELEVLLRALVAHARRIDVSAPRVLMSNVLRGHESFRAVLS